MLLYIMSRPHSGSTILDILMGNSQPVEGVGQLVSDMGELGNPCACGATIGDCPFWQAVRDEVEAAGIGWDEAVRASVGQAHVRPFLADLACRAERTPNCRGWPRSRRALAAAIAKVAGKPHRARIRPRSRRAACSSPNSFPTRS